MESGEYAYAALRTLEDYLRPFGESHSFRHLYDLIDKLVLLAEREVPERSKVAAGPAFAAIQVSSSYTLRAFEILQEFLAPLSPECKLHGVRPMIEQPEPYCAGAKAERNAEVATPAAIPRLNGLQTTADHGE